MKRRTYALVTLVLLLAAAGLEAQTTFGRVTVKIVDEVGDPLPGAVITVTCDALVDFREEKTTDKKGKVTFGFADATYTYNFSFAAEGYTSANTRIKPEIKKTTFRTFPLEKLSAAPPPAQPGTTTRVIYTAAEKVFNEGVKLLEAGDSAAAKVKFLEALEKEPEMALAHSALISVYLGENDQDAALASAKKLVELNPSNTRGHRTMYEVYRAKGQTKEADAALEALSALDTGGDTAALVFNEAVDAYDVGDVATAKARFEEALKVNPELAPALSALAGIYIQEKNYAQAAEAAEKLLVLEPEHLKALNIRHDAYRGLGDAEKTEAAAQALATVDPTAAAGGVFERGVALFEGGDAASAAAEFERVLEIDPNYSRAYYRLGMCHISLGDTAQAKANLEKFIEVAPEGDPEIATARDMIGYLQ